MHADSDQMKDNEMIWACITYWRNENVYGSLFGKAERKILRGRPRFGWENDIKEYLKQTGYYSVD
jgi:hypothetical protein